MISPVSGLKAACLGSSSSSSPAGSPVSDEEEDDDREPGSEIDEETEMESSSTISGAGLDAPVAETDGGVPLPELELELL